VAKASVRLVLQAALEAEATEFLGRDRYQRTSDPAASAARPGYRNGHQPLTIKTTSGPVTLQRPKLRGTHELFASRLLGKGVTRTNALESLVIAGVVRGLSTRDIEASLAEALGPEAAVSRSTVSCICQAIAEEFSAWQTRDLGGIDPLYVHLDASHFRYHEGGRAEPVLCAWAITADGKPALLGLDGIAAESTDACLGFLRDLTARGLTEPLLVIANGAPGLIAAVALAEARRRAGAFAAAWSTRYPRAVACVLDDLAELTTYLRFPVEHRARIRHTNLIERTFGETRRRTKVIDGDGCVGVGERLGWR
jgi:putative transposase